MLSTDNLHNMIALMRIQVLNLLSIGNRLFVTETKLPMIVHAPCINLVGIIQVKWVIPSTKDVFGILGACFLNFKRLLLFVSCLQLTSNFARFSVAPGIDFLTLGQCNCMLSSTHNFLNPLLRLRVENLGCNARRHLNFACWLAVHDVLYGIQS